MKLPKYRILTKKSVLDIPYENDEQNERELSALVDEQLVILGQTGILFTDSYIIHFFDSAYTSDRTNEEMDIDDAIQHLAIKDGYDLVQFENGNFGFVAYYNGFENGFEILVEQPQEFVKRITLATVGELIKELQQLNPKAKVYVAGEYGYMHIGAGIDGNQYVTFDDALDEYYEEDDEE